MVFMVGTIPEDRRKRKTKNEIDCWYEVSGGLGVRTPVGRYEVPWSVRSNRHQQSE